MNTRYTNFLFLLLITMFFFSCKKNIKEKISLVGTTMGSNLNVTFYSENESEHLKDSIQNFLISFEKEISTYDSMTWLSQYNKHKVSGSVSLKNTQYFKQLFSESFGAYLFSVGAFDPGMEPLFQLWKTMDKKGVPNQQVLDSIMPYSSIMMFELLGDSLLKKNKNAQLQFNAIAPGFAADWIAKILKRNNVNDFLIDVGGEFVTSGLKPNGAKWKIAIDKPEEERTPYMYIDVTDVAFATSGNYRKFMVIDNKTYGHTINPKTGKSALTDILSVTVFADKSSVADATATACMVMGSEKAFEFAKDFRALIITKENGELKLTKMNMDEINVELANKIINH